MLILNLAVSALFGGWLASNLPFVGPVVVAMFLGAFYGCRSNLTASTVMTYLSFTLSGVVMTHLSGGYTLTGLTVFTLATSVCFWACYAAGWYVFGEESEVDRFLRTHP